VDISAIPFSLAPDEPKFRQPDVPADRLAWIYHVSLAFEYRHEDDTEKAHEYCRRLTDDGFCSGDVSWSGIAFDHVPTVNEVEERVRKFVAAWFVAEKPTWRPDDPAALKRHKAERETMRKATLKATCTAVAEWWCTWFCHETFDRGQDPGAALASFQEYVWWVQSLPKNEWGNEPLCLMGAEDRWRWRGQDDENGNSTPAPCRCDGCKTSGKIRVNH